MQLKPPKPYRRGSHERKFFSKRWLWVYLLLVPVLISGYLVLKNPDYFRAFIVDNILNPAVESVATAVGPTPTPTPRPDLFLEEARSAYMLGNFHAAEVAYEKAAPLVPNDVDTHARLTFTLIRNGRYQEAIEAGQRAILANPESPAGYAYTALAYDWAGFSLDGLPYALHAIELDPDYARGYAILSELYTSLGSFDKAVDTAEKGIELDPRDFMAYRNLGMALERGYFDYDGALDAYIEALRLAPTMDYVAVNVFNIYYRLEEYQKGVDVLLEAINHNRTSPTLMLQLARAYNILLGEPERALEYLQQCVDANPDHPLCNGRLGQQLWPSIEQRDRALQYLDKAVRNGVGDYPDIYWSAGIAWSQHAGNCQRAVEVVREGLKHTDTGTSAANDLNQIIADCGFNPASALDSAAITPLASDAEAPPTATPLP